MNLTQTSRWRTLMGRAGCLIGVLLFLALLDGLISQFRQPANVLEVLPGDRLAIDGPLAEDVQDSRQLSYLSNSEQLQLSGGEVHKGFWLGGERWRGQLTVGPKIGPGEYTLVVKKKDGSGKQPPLAFQVIVHPDPTSLRLSSKSLSRRYLDLSPWVTALLLLAPLGLAFGIVFYLSQKMTGLLAESGKAEIYRVQKGDNAYQLAFGLGARHGIKPGDYLTIFNDQGQSLGTLEVQEVSEEDAIGTANLDLDLRPGYLVARS